MHGGVRRIVELLGHPSTGGVPDDFLCLGYGTLHTLAARGEDELCPEHGEECAPLQRHGLWHREHELVALGCGDEREGNARVAAGRLDNQGVGREDASFFGILDHGHADAILHAAEWVKKLAFEKNGSLQALGDAVEADQRGPADGFNDVLVDVSHGDQW